jgi:two-component sensor histidine kinase
VTFVSVGVPQNQTPERQREYATKNQLAGEFVFDRDGAAIAAYKVPHTSYVVVIDKSGKVVYTGVGPEQDIEAAVYFCTLEALQNVAKYAAATTVEVTIAERDGALAFEVRDDGTGFDPSANGNGTGLAGMRDRLAVFGGDAEIASALGRGTTVSGYVPLQAEAAR